MTYAAIMGVAYGRARHPVGSGRRRRRAAWRSPRHRLGLALGGVVAIASLALALPRLASELIGLPGRLVERELEAHVSVPLGDLDRAINAGKGAAAWGDAAANWQRVAMAQLALARRPKMLRNARRTRFELAEDALRHSLARARPILRPGRSSPSSP